MTGRNRRPLILPTPTLLDGVAFLVLWAKFTGRTEIDQ